MPSRPQPLKKGIKAGAAQGEAVSSCAHAAKRPACPHCARKSGLNAAAPALESAAVKKQITVLAEKIGGKLNGNANALQKAALILSMWLGGKPRK